MDTDILRCSVCLEFFKEPRLLPCGHSFCFTCLSNIATEDGRSLKCALCRSILQLPVLGIQALPINYYLTSCVCIVNSSKASYAAKEEAGEDGSPMPCDEILDRLLQLKSAFCGVHGTDQVKVFCHTCKTAICLSCVKSGDHARHSLVCLPYIVEKSKDRFRELRAMCVGVQTDADQKAAFLATSRMDMDAGIAGEDDSEIDEHMRGLLQDYNLNCASYEEELMKGQSRIAEAIAVCDRLLRETDEISCLAMEETSYKEVALVALDFKSGNSSTSINPAEASASQVHHAPAANERNGNFSAENNREEVFVDTSDARWQVDRVGDPSYGDGMVLPTELRRPGGWQMPWAVAAVEEGKFFATDARSLSEFKCDGEFAGDVPLPGYEQPCFPTGICKAPGNKLLITDSANGCLLLYDHGNRRILGNFGLGHLTEPYDVTVLSNNLIYVVDWFCHDLKVFNGDGLLVNTIGRHGSQPGEFEFPWSIASNSRQQLIVADNGNSRIQVLEADGRAVAQFSCVVDGEPRADSGKPRGIAVDENDAIYVCCGNGIHIFGADGRRLRKLDLNEERVHPFGIGVMTSGLDNRKYILMSERYTNTVKLIQL